MKKTFPHNNNQKEIKVHELPSRVLNLDEKERFRKFRKEYNRQRLPGVILCLALTLSMLYLFAYNLTKGNLPLKEIPPFSLLFLIPLICTLFFFRSLIPAERQPKRVQIGRLKGIWSISHGNNNGNATHYLHVAFPNGTHYRKVLTSRNEHKTVRPDCKVLVLSFDDKKVFGCSID